MTKLEQKYEDQMQSMLVAAKKWRAEHPDSNPIIQWNFPSNVAVIGTISDGIKHHFVNTNEDGLSLIKALWPWDCKTEPTMLMVKVVLENSNE